MGLMISLRCWIIPMLFWAVSDQSSCFSNSTLKLMFLNLSKSDQWFRRQGNLVGMSCTRYANPEFEKSETCIWEVTPSLLLRKSEVKKSILTNALKIRSNSRLSALRIWDLWLTNMSSQIEWFRITKKRGTWKYAKLKGSNWRLVMIAKRYETRYFGMAGRQPTDRTSINDEKLIQPVDPAPSQAYIRVGILAHLPKSRMWLHHKAQLPANVLICLPKQFRSSGRLFDAFPSGKLAKVGHSFEDVPEWFMSSYLVIWIPQKMGNTEIWKPERVRTKMIDARSRHETRWWDAIN